MIVDTPLSFDEVTRRLRNERGDASIPGIIALAKEARTESEYIGEITKCYVGRSGFMLFGEIDHGGWLTAFGIKRRTVRLILGNPLIAKAMIRNDVTAGLFAAVELLVTEYEDRKETNPVYVRPSSLIVVGENGPLRQVANALDTKFGALVTSATAV